VDSGDYQKTTAETLVKGCGHFGAKFRKKGEETYWVIEE